VARNVNKLKENVINYKLHILTWIKNCKLLWWQVMTRDDRGDSDDEHVDDDNNKWARKSCFWKEKVPI